MKLEGNPLTVNQMMVLLDYQRGGEATQSQIGTYKSDIEVLIGHGLLDEKGVVITDKGVELIKMWKGVTVEPKPIEKKVEFMKIGLGIANMPIDDKTAEFVILTYEEILKKGETFTISDSIKIQKVIDNKYNN